MTEYEKRVLGKKNHTLMPKKIIKSLKKIATSEKKWKIIFLQDQILWQSGLKACLRSFLEEGIWKRDSSSV